ncbi:bis(5'-nucleosyl)-tetraphosphatase (symmetrical) YqeK [Weissella hellenica]|uniref:bis(5'-nucleosyl)-tetraphosphatase (symmetrical) n=1 Tax=Weissella hellenica TaxID=46256 RepID=A0A4Y4G8F4_WEIHE|nr:bis(5'-nucleosyl)-tetraphosphatase (symmetrical) YqeK [Weissella hellenica]NKY66839.1 HD domain-containing protein [Weissella hellenica]GED35768.1 HD domain-containing protein [Weissella hellenica]SCB89436.1 putative HD superfamily hydrolase of NAD metabolism [Weissella hellenica]
MTDKLIYTQKIFSGSRELLIDKVSQALSTKRFEHVLRVEEMALQLAEKWHVDAELASIAALTHDYAKERSDEDFLREIEKKQLDRDLTNWGNNVWHGVVGAEMVKDELGIAHEDILNAIRQHTTGATVMTKLSQILYMADYIETGRDFPGVEDVRALAFDDLAASVGWQTAHTLTFLLTKKVSIYPGTLLTYNTWSVDK